MVKSPCDFPTARNWRSRIFFQHVDGTEFLHLSTYPVLPLIIHEENSARSLPRDTLRALFIVQSRISRSFGNQPLTLLFRYSFYYQLLYVRSSFWTKFMFYPDGCELPITQRYHLRITIIYRNSILSFSIIIENFWICKFSILWTSQRKSQEQTSLKLIIIDLNGEVCEYRSWLLVNCILKFQGKSAAKMPWKKFVSNMSPDIVRALLDNPVFMTDRSLVGS